MYTYQNLLDESDFLKRCGGARIGSVGKTLDGREIPYIFVGTTSGPQIIITAGIHAREHIGSYLAVRQAARYLSGQRTAGKNKDTSDFLKFRIQNPESRLSGGIYFIPMCNPDGNALISKGLCGIRRAQLRRGLPGILKNKNRSLFKANARGVDLNVNFDARWGTGKQNARQPGTENYIGLYPFSESETRALRDFTMAVRPSATVSYHCIGRELYWEFGQTGGARVRDLSIAQHLNERLGYKIVSDDGSSAGGYKDWCIQALGIPSFTIELVSEEHTHPFTDYRSAKEDIERNLDLPERLLRYLC